MSRTAKVFLATAFALGCTVLPASALEPQTGPAPPRVGDDVVGSQIAGGLGGEQPAGGQIAGVGRQGRMGSSHGGNRGSHHRFKTYESKVSAQWEHVRSRM